MCSWHTGILHMCSCHTCVHPISMLITSMCSLLTFVQQKLVLIMHMHLSYSCDPHMCLSHTCVHHKYIQRIFSSHINTCIHHICSSHTCVSYVQYMCSSYSCESLVFTISFTYMIYIQHMWSSHICIHHICSSHNCVHNLQVFITYLS